MKKIIILITCLVITLSIPLATLMEVAPTAAESYYASTYPPISPSLKKRAEQTGYELGQQIGEALIERLLENLGQKAIKPFIYEFGDLKWGTDGVDFLSRMEKYIDDSKDNNVITNSDGVIVTLIVDSSETIFQDIATIFSLNFMIHRRKGLYHISNAIMLKPDHQKGDYHTNLDIVFRHIKMETAYKYGVPASDDPNDKNPLATWILPDKTSINIMMVDTGDPTTSLIKITYIGSYYYEVKDLMNYEKSLGIEW